MKHTAAYAALFGVLPVSIHATGQVSWTLVAVLLVFVALLLVSENFELLAYLCLPALRKTLLKFFKAQRDR